MGNDGKHIEPPPLVKWILWLFRKETWQSHPVAATITVVIVLGVAYAGVSTFISQISGTSFTNDTKTNQNSSVSNPIDYALLLAAILEAADVYCHYAERPPKATYDEFATSEQKLKNWLIKNKLYCDKQVWDLSDSFILTIRNWFDDGNLEANFLGGGGRPDKEELNQHKNELLKQFNNIDARVRQVLEGQ